MTNIKNNKLPFFKNPNSSLALVNLEAARQVELAEAVGQLQSLTAVDLSKVQQSLALTVSTAAVAQGYKASSLGSKNLVFLQKKGSQIPNPNIISYNFLSKATSRLALALPNLNKLVTNNVYKLLFNFFKSMYCLISKPVFITTPDKIKIQLFYFLCIPKFLINKTVIGDGKGLGLLTKSGQSPTTKSMNQKPDFVSSRFYQAYNKSSSAFNSKDLNVKVNLKRLTQSNLTKVYPHKFKLLCAILSKFFNKNVELELIRLHQPYYDSNILVNFLALIINKKNIGACIQRLYNSNIIKANKASAFVAGLGLPSSRLALASQAATLGQVNQASYLSGLNIKISGRLMREPIIPRITTKKFEKGFTAKGKISYFDLARFTHKNRKGAFTITVKSGQNF